jgi:RNA polymerase sigma factor (sigma-70 family)
VARNVWREEVAKRPRILTPLDEMTDGAYRQIASKAESSEEYARREAQLECLQKCLTALPPEQRKLITHYYRGDKDTKIKGRRELADELGIPLNALRIRASRLRGKLEVCLRKCLQGKSPQVK